MFQIPLLKPKDPLYDPDELYGIASVDFSKVYDIREVIARVVDGSVFDEFKQLYGDTIVTGMILLENGDCFMKPFVSDFHQQLLMSY